MKKILLTSVLALATIASFAQGSIQVGNGITGVRFPIYGPQVGQEGVTVRGSSALSQPTGSTVYTGGLLSGTRYQAEFWAGPASATDYSGLTLITTIAFRTGTSATALPNGITATLPSGIINGVVPGAQAKLGIRVWDTLSGASYALAGVRGEGLLFLSAPLGGNPPGGGTPITAPAWTGESFSLTAVPEPSSMALAGLGAAALMIFRRRK